MITNFYSRLSYASALRRRDLSASRLGTVCPLCPACALESERADAQDRHRELRCRSATHPRLDPAGRSQSQLEAGAGAEVAAGYGCRCQGLVVWPGATVQVRDACEVNPSSHKLCSPNDCTGTGKFNSSI